MKRQPFYMTSNILYCLILTLFRNIRKISRTRLGITLHSWAQVIIECEMQCKASNRSAIWPLLPGTFPSPHYNYNKAHFHH